MARPGIDNVQSVQSQWVGPYTFAYKAEVDFDGTYLAAKLMARWVVGIGDGNGNPDRKKTDNECQPTKPSVHHNIHHHRYEDEFLGSPQLKDDLPVLLAFYAEDVVRTLEREVRDVEREIRWVRGVCVFKSGGFGCVCVVVWLWCGSWVGVGWMAG